MPLKYIRQELEELTMIPPDEIGPAKFRTDINMATLSEYDIRQISKISKFLDKESIKYQAKIARENSLLRQKSYYKRCK